MSDTGRLGQSDRRVTRQCPPDRLAALIDECYQRGLDAPEAATFLRAAGVTLAPTPPDALLEARAALLAELEAGVEGLDGYDAFWDGEDLVSRAAVLDLIRKAGEK